MIEFSDVWKSFGRQEVLRGASLSVAPGEYVAIMGKSGAGKSTLLHILGALEEVDRGEYTVAGKPVHRLSARKRTRLRNEEIGFVFQQFQLIPNLSVYQNVRLPLTYGRKKLGSTRRRVLEAIDAVGLTPKKGQKPSRLSGGEKQRVAIARALVNEPSLLLADEPTGSLDEATTESILAIFDEVHARGTTIVMITHDPEVAARAERIVYLREGALV